MPDDRIPYVGLRTPVHVGRSIKDARIAAGLTQADLAHEARVSAVLISEVESGRRAPRLETLVALADALGLVVALLPRPDAAYVRR